MIHERIGLAATYEGIAEEAVELAHEAQKLARILREENPTPAKFQETFQRLEKEYTQMMVYVEDLDLNLLDWDEFSAAERRFMRRWEEYEDSRAAAEKSFMEKYGVTEGD